MIDACRLNENQRRLLTAISRHSGGLTTSETALRFDVSQHTTNNRLNQLLCLGFLTRKALAGRTSRWFLSDEGTKVVAILNERAQRV